MHMGSTHISKVIINSLVLCFVFLYSKISRERKSAGEIGIRDHQEGVQKEGSENRLIMQNFSI